MANSTPTPAPKYRVIGDDWSFRVQFAQPNGQPFDLTGASIHANLFRAYALAPILTLSLGAGASIVNGNPTLGTVDFLVAGGDGGITGTFLGQDIDFLGPNFPDRLAPSIIDGLGRRFTPQIVPIVPIDPRSTRVIPPLDVDPVTVQVGSQGPAGPGSAGQMVSASRPPSDADGVDGQFWIDTGSGTPAIYGPKANGAWPDFGFTLGARTSRQSLDFSDPGNAGFTNP